MASWKSPVKIVGYLLCRDGISPKEHGWLIRQPPFQSLLRSRHWVWTGILSTFTIHCVRPDKQRNWVQRACSLKDSERGMGGSVKPDANFDRSPSPFQCFPSHSPIPKSTLALLSAETTHIYPQWICLRCLLQAVDALSSS